MILEDKATKEMEIAESEAINEMKKRGFGNKITIRSLRPDDIEDFTAGTTGTSKTMGENDLTVATGTTENTLSYTLSTNEAFVLEGLYLPPVTGITTSYLSFFIGDAKQRWYRGDRVNIEPNYTLYFDDPLIVLPGETVKVKFLTSAASATHPIQVLGKVVKAHS